VALEVAAAVGGGREPVAVAKAVAEAVWAEEAGAVEGRWVGLEGIQAVVVMAAVAAGKATEK